MIKVLNSVSVDQIKDEIESHLNEVDLSSNFREIPEQKCCGDCQHFWSYCATCQKYKRFICEPWKFICDDWTQL